MSLKHALLGFLNYQPQTGYELKRNFDTSIRHFWPASLSQIYPTLRQLETDGLVTMKVHYQDKRPNRKVYHITGAGREEIRRWLLEPLPMEPVRQPGLIKMWFGGTLTNEEMSAVLRQAVKPHRERLAMLTGFGKEFLEQVATGSGLVRDARFWGMVHRSGVVYEEMIISWLEECIQEIEAMPDKEP